MLYETIQTLMKHGWELRHIRLKTDKAVATVVAPKIEYEYDQITFDNDTSHITIHNHKEFQIYDSAIFSDTIDTKEIIIQDGNIRIHIEFRKSN